MPKPIQIIGSYLSPYVRKALVALEVKGLAYEIDPIIPFILGDVATPLPSFAADDLRSLTLAPACGLKSAIALLRPDSPTEVWTRRLCLFDLLLTALQFFDFPVMLR